MENNNENLKNSNSENSSFFEQKVSSSNGNEGYPKLRFKINNAAWRKKRLDKVCHINPTNNNLPEKFYYIDLECVEKGELVKNLNLISKELAPSRAQRLLAPNDMLYQTVRPYQKNNFLFKQSKNYPTVASTGYAQIRSDKNDIRYLYQLLHTDNFVIEAMKRSTGTGYPAISSSDLAEIEIYLPEINEQEKIADFLSLIDQRIEKQRQLVESLKKYKRGLFKYVFDILSDAPFYPLKDIAELIKGTQLSKINMIKNGKFYVLNGGIIPSGRTNSYNTIANTISISEGGNSCGYVNYNTQPFWSGGHCYTLQNISDFMNERFLWHYLKFQEKNIMMLRIGSGLPNIQKASLLNFLVLVPELKVQNKYAMIFDKIENFENAQFEILKNLNLLKQSLLQQMFI